MKESCESEAAATQQTSSSRMQGRCHWMVRSSLSVKTKDDYTAPVSNGLYGFWQEDDMRLIANVRLIAMYAW